MRRLLMPAEGRLVRDPETKARLPEEGKWVTLNTFWRRRLADGDVIAVIVGIDEGTAVEAEPVAGDDEEEN